MNHSQTPRWTLFSQAFIEFFCFAALCAAMVFHSLTQYINQDEEQYITASYLAQHTRLYADFIYLQLPVYPLVVSKLLMLFSGVSPFLLARLLSAALAIGTVVLFFSLAVRLSESVVFAFVLASIFASSPLMLLGYGSARNDIMPIFFGLLGGWLTLCALDAERKRSGSYLVLLAGICMALAVGAKATAAFIPLSATLYIFLRAKPRLLPFLLGGAVGALPIVYYAAIAFDKFLYGSVVFHLTIRQKFYIDVGQAEILTWSNRAKGIALAWVDEPTLIAASLFVVFIVFIAWHRGLRFRTLGEHLPAHSIFIIFLVLASIPFVFLPNPFGLPYLQPAVPYVLLTSAALYPLAQKILQRQQMLVFVTMAGVVLAAQIGRFVTEAGRQLSAPQWTVTEIHELSAFIARYAPGGPVATVYPAFALDAGTPVYPEFAASPYFFRAGDHLPTDRVLKLRGITPRTLPLLLAMKPPAAVFAANTADDLPLLNWAQHNCYVEIDLVKWQGRVYDKNWKPRLFVLPHDQGPCGIK